jgi:hypothetical protein
MIQRIILWHFNLRISAIAFIGIIILSACQSNGPADSAVNTANIPPLIYTKHAKCRMACRHINEAEIKEIIAENHINERKSSADSKPCPTSAYEGYSNEHQHLRIVIAKCDNTWKVVTCIDLGNEFECDCH